MAEDFKNRYSSRKICDKDVIDLIEHWDLTFCEGNILKYLLRKKGEDISDLKKIIDYAGRRIKQINDKNNKIGKESSSQQKCLTTIQ